MMLFDVLSSTMSSTWPIFCPAVFFTVVPMTFLARIAEVCPDAVVMRCLLLDRVSRDVMGGRGGACIGRSRARLSAHAVHAWHGTTWHGICNPFFEWRASSRAHV